MALDERTPLVQEESTSSTVHWWQALLEPHEEVDNDEEDPLNVSICQIVAIALVVLVGLFLIVMAIWPFLPFAMSKGTVNLDWGERKLVELDAYWFTEVNVDMVMPSKPVKIDLMPRKPMVNDKTRISKKLEWTLVDGGYGSSRWTLFKNSKFKLKWHATNQGTILILRTEEAFRLWLTWNAIDPQFLVFQSDGLQGSTQFDLFFDDVYYLVYTGSNPKGTSWIDVDIQAETYEQKPSMRTCQLTMESSCRFHLPEFLSKGYLLFSAMTNDSVQIEKEAPFQLQYTCTSRNNIFTSWWPFWVLLGIVGTCVALFVLLIIIGLTCRALGWLCEQWFPWLLEDDETQSLLEGSYTGYGVYEGEALPLYQNPPGYEDIPMPSREDESQASSFGSHHSLPPAYEP